MEDVVALIDARSAKISGETVIGSSGMDERIWVIKYAWIGGAILIVLIFVVSAVIGRATRSKGEGN
jgi:hypothetical protein